MSVSVYRARRLRKQLTRWEAILWSRLRALRAEGLHVRRQAPFRGYILDFVCFERRLVIELDGDHHSRDEVAARDAVRDTVLVHEGFEVLRFQNREVTANLDGVIRHIVETLRSLPPTRPATAGHPPHEGEG